MSTEERILSVADINAIEAEEKKFIASVERMADSVTENYKKIKSVTGSMGNNNNPTFTGLEKNIEEVNAGLVEMQKNLQKLNSTPVALPAATKGVKKYGDESTKAAKKVKEVEAANNNLRFSMMQVTRELPAISYGWGTFFGGISNNIAGVRDGMKQMRIANAEMAAQGKATVPVWKTMAQSIFSWETAIMIGLTALIEFGRQQDKNTKSTDASTEAINRQRDALKGLIQTGREEIDTSTRTLHILNSIAKDRTLSDEQRANAIKEMRSSYPTYLKGYTDEQIKAGAAAKAITEIEEAITNKAKAQTAANYAAKQYSMLYDAETGLLMKRDQAQAKLNNAVERYNKVYQAAGPNKEQNQSIDEAANSVKLARQEFEGYNSAIAATKASYAKASSEAEKYAKKAGDLFFAKSTVKEPPQKQPLDLTNARLEAAERLAKARADLAKSEMEVELINAEELMNSQKENYQTQLAALENYYRQKSLILIEDEMLELSVLQQKLDKIKEIEGKDVSKRTNQEKLLLVEKEALLAEEEAIIVEYQIKQTAITSEYSQKRADITKKGLDEETAYRLDALNKIQRQNEEGYTDEVKALVKSLQDGEIKVKEYNRRLALIEDKYARGVAIAQIKYLEDELSTFEGTTEKKEELAKKLHDLLIRLGVIEAAAAKTTEDIKQEQIRETIRLMNEAKQLADEVITYMLDMQSKKTDRILRDLDREETASDQQTENEVKAIQLSQKTQVEKEEAIAEAQKNGENRRQEIEQRRTAAEQRRAQYEKANAIFKIATSTFIAVAKEMEKGVAGFFTASAIVTYLTGIAGAVSALTVPAYKEGKIGHPGGLAWTGDGGERELIKSPGKAPYWSPDTPTLMDLPKGTDVIPEHKLTEVDGKPVIAISTGNNGGLTDAGMSKHTNAIKEAIKSLPVTIVAGGRTYTHYKEGHDRNNYLSKSFYK